MKLHLSTVMSNFMFFYDTFFMILYLYLKIWFSYTNMRLLTLPCFSCQIKRGPLSLYIFRYLVTVLLALIKFNFSSFPIQARLHDILGQLNSWLVLTKQFDFEELREYLRTGDNIVLVDMRKRFNEQFCNERCDWAIGDTEVNILTSVE